MREVKKMSIPNAPCKGCVAPKRFSGCHDVCPEYLKFKDDKLQYNLQLASIKHTNAYFQEGAVKHRKLKGQK